MADSAPGILIFGGTFDPPHLAHTRLPPVAARRLGCDRVIYVPAALNPLKTDTPPTPATHRLAMLRLATRDVEHAEIDTLELDRAGPSFTVDTLTIMRERFGAERRLHRLIGADAAISFERWKDWRRILELAEPAVMPRPPWPREALEREFCASFDDELAEFWIAHLIDVPYLDASATEVRTRMDAGADLRGLVDDQVAEYIRKHNLYA